MKDVRVKTVDLLTKIRGNREAHKAEYDEAIVGYRAEVLKHVEAMLADAVARKDPSYIGMPHKPKEYLREYDRAIAMCEATVDEEVVLSATDFGRFWLDDWEWMESFKSGTSSYNRS